MRRELRKLSVVADSVEIGGPPAAPMGLSLGVVPVELWMAVVRGAEVSVVADSVKSGGPPGARMGRSLGVGVSAVLT
jgi:hypothetical protein